VSWGEITSAGVSEQETSPPSADAAVEDPEAFRSGFVALCGRPNVGKSTLLNALLGEHLAVVTKLPQTTRERMLGIWTTDAFQAVLVDTPGIHRAKSALNRYMVAQALRGAKDVDLVLMLAEVPRLRDDEQALKWEPGPGATAVLDALKELETPIVLVLTKCDQVDRSDLLLPVIERWRERHAFVDVIATSGLQGKGLEALREVIVAHLPVGPRYYDPEQLSDRDMRWHAAELIRAEVFKQLSEELPYSSAVTVESFKEGTKRDRVRAVIHVERDSQKGIVIGKGGQRIKSISMAARERIGQLTGRPCDLVLDVRVTSHWTRDPKKLERLGYSDHEEGGG
jgi:GTP-binding protein Era